MRSPRTPELHLPSELPRSAGSRVNRESLAGRDVERRTG